MMEVASECIILLQCVLCFLWTSVYRICVCGIVGKTELEQTISASGHNYFFLSERVCHCV